MVVAVMEKLVQFQLDGRAISAGASFCVPKLIRNSDNTMANDDKRDKRPSCHSHLLKHCSLPHCCRFRLQSDDDDVAGQINP